MRKKKKKKRTQPSPGKSPRADRPAKPTVARESSDAHPFWRALGGEPVAIGIAIFIFLRPWIDGLTFVSFNAYYIAGILLIAALWGVRTLVRGESIRFAIPLGLLAAYLGVSFLTGLVGYEYHLTHRAVQYLASYFLLFFVCSNALRSRFAIGIVLAAFVATVLLNATWSVIHYHQTLPFMREVLMGNSDILYSFFGTRELTPDLKHRLEMNRAFGTFLFPNALAAFLILAIPYLLSELWASWHERTNGVEAVEEESPALSSVEAYRRVWFALGVGTGIALVLSIVLILLNDRLGALNGNGERPVENLLLQLFIFGVFPTGLGTASGIVLRRYGLSTFGRMVRVVGVALALPATTYALWLSYSRGAVLALALAMGISLALFLIGRRAKGSLAGAARSMGVALLFLTLARALIAAPAAAQEMNEPEMRPTGILAIWDSKKLDTRTLSVEGTGRTIGDLSDVNSFGLRITYWQVSLLMLKDNFWTGVGPGNFKVAYPTYQFLDAGDVEAAHNDFLQNFCETGAVGGSLFLAFWIYFAVWGGRRIVREPDASQRAVLAGLYAGVLAFLLHSLLDFNLTNPALASLVYVLAGIFYARAHAFQETGEQRQPAPTRFGRFVAIPVLLVVVLLTGSVLRSYLFDLALTEGTTAHRFWQVGDRKPFKQHLEVAKFFLIDLKKRDKNQKNAPATLFSAASLLIPDRALLESFGAVRIRVPGDSPTLRPPRPEEVLPNDAYLFITDIPRARKAAIAAAERRITFLREADELYPHDPEMAAHIYSWYEMLFASVTNPAERKRYAHSALEWSRTCVERSPRAAWFHIYYAKALWLRGSVESGQAALDYYTKGIQEYGSAYEMYPISPVFASQYGQALLKLGKALVDSGRIEAGEEMREKGTEVIKVGTNIEGYKRLPR